jgi:RHS repeat-associated protein
MKTLLQLRKAAFGGFLLKGLLRLCAVVLTCVAFAGLAQSPPDLLIDYNTGSRFRLSWANTPDNIVLEEADSLSPPGVWRPFPEAPVLLKGRFTVTVDHTGTTRRFFRLHLMEPGGLPPDPASVASPIPQGVATLLAGATEFLYTGPNPIQTGVAPGTIETRRVAILRGNVMDRSGGPLPGVRITIPAHAEFGQTLTRVDGMFDLAVNGGGPLTIDYTKAGYLPAQRQVNAPWRDYINVPDVALIPLDTNVTAIAANAGTMQVHQSSVSTDSDGSRKATLLFPAGTTAMMVMADGTTQALSDLNVRASEYTVGPNGPKAMPGELPPTSAYTYAVEFSVDQAIAANADTVTFNQPIPTYVENFLGFPVGENVPLGHCDRKAGAWVPSKNGRVIKITAINGGTATIDTVGTRGLPPVVLDSAEREKLASLYSVGQELWRMPVTHFSAWDANWGVFPPEDAEPPSDDPDGDEPLDDSCTLSGNSTIEAQNQILGETIGMVGTPFGLQYQSERVPGYKNAYMLDIPLSGATLPGSVTRIELEILIAGRFIKQSFSPAPNQRTTFVWDGKDAYGRTLQGVQRIVVRIGYTYTAVYASTPQFGYSGNAVAITGSPARDKLTLWRTWESGVGSWDARAAGLGGWTLTAHHTFDPIGGVLYRGDGRRQSTLDLGPIINTMAGGIFGGPGDGVPATQTEVYPRGLAAAPDGSFYIAEAHRIRRVAPNGIITTVAGTGVPGFSGDGGPATQARLNSATAIAVGSDGSLYIADLTNRRVRRVDPGGIIRTVAGNGNVCSAPNLPCGDGGLATLAPVGPKSVAVAPDGTLYIGDGNTRRVRRVTPDGIISTVAGNGGIPFSATDPAGDGGPATNARLFAPDSLAISLDGSLYISDSVLNRVRRVTPDGIILTIAGTGGQGFSGDGGPARNATFRGVGAITFGRDESLFIFDAGNRRIRWLRPDGTIHTLAGNGTNSITGDGGLAARAALMQPDQAYDSAFAMGPDGSLYLSQTGSSGPAPRVRRISSSIKGLAFDGGGLAAALDGSEVYVLAPGGRHLRTVDALTGALRQEFGYDSAGRLASITDGDTNITTIERDLAGAPTAIVAPFGQRTALTVNPDGFLSHVSSPSGESLQMNYTADGLLTSLTNPRGHTSSYTFDPKGLLTSATDPAAATKTLARTGTNQDFTVTITSPLGRTTSYRVERLNTGDMKLTTTGAGCQVQTLIGRDGTETSTSMDGTTTSFVPGPDPRWGMQTPLPTSTTLRTPSGLVQTSIRQRTATLTNPGDLLNLSALTETATVNGRLYRQTYDVATRTFTATSPAGRRSTAIIDTRGRVGQTQFGGLAAAVFTYDSRGRLATMTQGSGADSRTTTIAYSGSGFLQSITDPANQTESLSRDANGRVTEVTFHDSAKSQFVYDANGNLTTLTPPGRPDHHFTYTQNNQVSTHTAPAVGAGNNQTLATYDEDRQPTAIDRPNGESALFVYDAEGRLILVKTMAGDMQYGLDTCGRVITLNREHGANLSFTYDGGLPVGTTWSGAVTGSVTRAYDNSFRVATLSVNGGSPITLSYDQDGLLAQVGDLTLTRNAQSGLVTATALGSVIDTMTYDTFGALAGYTVSQGGSEIYSTTYARDAVGRVATKSETIGGVTDTFTYTYDSAGHLIEVRQDNILTARYTYDPNGNRLSRIDTGGTTTATYDAQDRLEQFGTTTCVHNAAGERTSQTAAGQTTRYQYDSLGNLTGVTLPNGTQIEYVLDGRHRRVARKVNGSLVQGFLYQDVLKPIAELDGSNNVVSRFVYAEGINVPAYMIKTGVTYRIVTDRLGSPRLVIDVATGSIAQRLDYDEFGRVTLDTSPGFQPFGFAGGIYDPDTRLVRFGVRTYDAETGRWTTKDPMSVGRRANLYDYTANDPVNFIDPLGNQGNPVDPFASTGVAAPTAPAYETRFEQQERLFREQVQAWSRQESRTFFTSDASNPFRGSLVPKNRPGQIGSTIIGELGGNYSVRMEACRINPPAPQGGTTYFGFQPLQHVQTATGLRAGVYAATLAGLELAAKLEPWVLLALTIDFFLPHTVESPFLSAIEYLETGRLPPGISE